VKAFFDKLLISGSSIRRNNFVIILLNDSLANSYGK
jgi:hypothetical protein